MAHPVSLCVQHLLESTPQILLRNSNSTLLITSSPLHSCFSVERMEVELPTQELRDAAAQLLGETAEVRTLALAKLRQQLHDSNIELDLVDTSDASLLRFLRGKKFNVDSAQKCVERLVVFNKENPLWTESLTDDEFVEFKHVVQFLEHRDKNNRVIMFVKASKLLKLFTPEFRQRHPYGLIRFNIYLINLLTYNHDVQVHGLVILGSFSDLSLWDTTTLATIAPVNERLGFFKYISQCCAMRIGGIYIFDEPFYLRWMWNVLRRFLSTKMKTRFHLCTRNFQRLEGEVVTDLSVVPQCIGGQYDIDDNPNYVLQ